jgi:hypothetical protein
MAFITVIVKQDKEQLKRIEDKLDLLLACGNDEVIKKAAHNLDTSTNELKEAVDKNTPSSKNKKNA